MLAVPAHPQARAVIQVITKLRSAGYEAYLAGGSVRDILLGKIPKDYDVVTSAQPEAVEKLFPQTHPIGKQFGIILVQSGRHTFEIATFRGESGYSDRRRPDRVFWSTAEQDVRRRDFTINALLLDPLTGKIIDYIKGERDLEARLIRFVGDPVKRVQEDHLRILRAIRFKNTLGFQYDRPTYAALAKYAHLVASVSPERLRQEIDLMLADPSRAQSLRELDKLGILEVLLPELSRLHGVPQPIEYHHEGDVFDHSLLAVESLPRRSPSFLAWATLLHDIGKAQTIHYPKSRTDRIRFDHHAVVGANVARSIGRRFHMTRAEIETIAWLVEHHMSLKYIDRMREAKRREYLLDPRFKWLLELHRADASGTIPKDLSLYREARHLYARYLKLWEIEQQQGRPHPLLTGDDLQKLGMAPGKKLGRVLKRIQVAQLERKISNRAEALDLAKSLINHVR